LGGPRISCIAHLNVASPEDASALRLRNAAAYFALLHRIALTLFRMDSGRKPAQEAPTRSLKFLLYSRICEVSTIAELPAPDRGAIA
jgi:hypothetical protein